MNIALTTEALVIRTDEYTFRSLKMCDAFPPPTPNPTVWWWEKYNCGTFPTKNTSDLAVFPLETKFK